MEKKFKFSDKPISAKIIYAAVIAILCVSAIVIGIVSASQRGNETPSDNPPIENPPVEKPDGNEGGTGNTEDEGEKKLTFISPIVGEVVKEHSLEIPVYSTTLGEWRVHTGIDISAELGDAVYASEAGTVTNVYSDAMHGYTVEITHEDGIKTRYSNLDAKDAGLVAVGAAVESGERIGTVGDSSISELAEEPHLHFEMLVNDVKVNPLDYISDESKEASLGIQ